MSNIAIHLDNLGKLYKLYRRPMDKILDVFGIQRWMFWRQGHYQEFWALRGVHLEIRTGERVGIIGRNGAGKSTLLKIISKTVTPTEGTVTVNGRIQALLELGTGFHPEFTGRQNIHASLAYQGFSIRRIREKEEDIIDFAELEDFIDQPIKTYSAGMYARLAFATATVIEPEILIIDEVLGAGDAYFAGKCVERMKRLTEESGATVLFVSHDIGSIQRFCNRVIWIDRGRIQRQGEVLETIKAYTAMIRQEEGLRLKAREWKILKKQAALLDTHEDVYDPLLFHLVSAHGQPPQGCHRIFALRLRLGQEEIGAIAVGSPMDNAPEHLHYLMDTPRYMNWGPAQKVHDTYYREYGNFQGKYAHAPFEFALPKTFRQSSPDADFYLEVEAEALIDEVAVEVYAQGQYIRLGCLPCGPRQWTAFRLPQHLLFVDEKPGLIPVSSTATRALLETASPVATVESQETPAFSEYGSGEARILAVHMLNDCGVENRIFETGEPFTVVLDFEASTALSNPVFVFCIYLIDGQCFTQWCVSTQELGHKIIQGSGRVYFRVQETLFGQASYVASAAIFKYLRKDGKEGESYHVLDRCIHFQMVRPLGDATERGLCLQPFTVDLQMIS